MDWKANALRKVRGVAERLTSDTADNMQTNIEPPVRPAEANDSRTASDKAVVCKELLESLAERFERNARFYEQHRNCVCCDDSRAVSQSMIFIYGGIAAVLRAESEKLSNDKLTDAGTKTL